VAHHREEQGLVIASDNAGPPSPPVAPDTRPLLAEGVELIGEYEGSGYKEAPSLVRRPDGQVIQLPDLLYRLAALADGQRTYDQVAEELGRAVERTIDADDVRFLVDEKLRPIGVLAAADGSSPPGRDGDPLLGFKYRLGVVSERTSGRLGTLFKPLFLPPVVLAALVGLVAADAWLFFVHGVAQSVRQSILNPALFLVLFAFIVLSAAFHEMGHAAGCRYGGGRPGKMGCGLYLAWPAFYTDVTDAYRLGRRDRLRTDLGGVYFNILIVLATVGAYLLTGFEPLLLLAVIQHFEIVHQLMPIVRLDGYYIVADLTGVPDLFARIGPILTSAVPGRRADERVTVLKRWVRVAVTIWVLVVVPLLAFELLLVLIHLPRILATAWSSGSKLYDGASAAFGNGAVLNGVSSVLQLLVLAIPIVGILLMLQRFLRQGATWAWRTTQGRPVARTLAVLVGSGALVLLALAWVPKDNYQPIGPHDKGTMGQAVSAATRATTSPGRLADPIASATTDTTTPPTTEAPVSVPVTVTTVAPQLSTTVAAAQPTTSVVRPATTVAVSTVPPTTTPRPTTTVP